jgi:hypothetical protein
MEREYRAENKRKDLERAAFDREHGGVFVADPYNSG